MGFALRCLRARAPQRAVAAPHVTAIGEAADAELTRDATRLRVAAREVRHQPVRECGEALDHARREVEQRVAERLVLRALAELREHTRRHAAERGAADERSDRVAAASPLGRRERSGIALALDGVERFEAAHRGVEAGEHAHLVLAGEPIQRPAHLRARPRHELGELERDLEPAVFALEAVQEQGALRDALARGARAELGAAGEEARHARAHQLREREQMRAAERAAERATEAAHEAGVELLADERLEPWRGIAAGVSARVRRRLERHRRLRAGEAFDARARGVHLERELHVVDEAGGLEIAAGRHEAALAEIEDHALDAHVFALATERLDRQGARVQREAAHDEGLEGAVRRHGRAV